MYYLEEKVGQDVFGHVLTFCDPVMEAQKQRKKLVDLLFDHAHSVAFSRFLKIPYSLDLWKIRMNHLYHKKNPPPKLRMCKCDGHHSKDGHKGTINKDDKALGMKSFKAACIKQGNHFHDDNVIPDWFIEEIYGKCNEGYRD
jgi:hypothetical protein